MLDIPWKRLVKYKRQVNTYLALNINRCQYCLNESVIVNIEVKTLIEQYKSSFLINSNYLDYIKNMLKNTKKNTKKIKIKYINVLKIEWNKQMCQFF